MGAFFHNAWDILLRYAGAAAGLLGGGDLAMLCALMALDYITGMILAFLGKSTKSPNGRISARASFLGLLRKGVMMGVILLAAVLDQVAGEGEWLRRAATGFYICNEGISLLENAARLGVPVPRGLRSALSALQKKENA